MGKTMSSGSSSNRRILGLLLLAVVTAVIRTWALNPVIVCGTSMLPTCRDGQFGLLEKLSYHWRLPERGDLVCVWTGAELYNKRIVGLPGEEIAFREGILYVNGRAVSEPYVQER